MKLLLKGCGVRIPFPEIPGVKLRIVFFDRDEGRKQSRTNIIVLFGYTTGLHTICPSYTKVWLRDHQFPLEAGSGHQ